MTSSALILLLMTLVAANLPFLVERILFVRKPETGSKHIGWRLLELVLLYFVMGGVAYLVERNLGPVQPQRWEFYAVTACLFLVFAFPGFMYRYLWRKR